MNWNRFFFLLTILSFISTCSQVDVNGLDPDLFTKSGNGNGNTTTAFCKDVDFTFSTKVLPVFASKCSGTGCHVNGGTSGSLNLDPDDDTRGDGESGVIGNIIVEGEINSFTTAQSPLLLKVLDTAEGGQGLSHGGGVKFETKTDPDYKKLFCWIEDGAKNDLSTSECSFGKHVYPIFKKRGCTAGNCHDSSSPAGNMNLSQGSVTLLTDTSGGTGVSTFAKATLQPVIGTVTDSLILKKPLLDGVTHTGGKVFSGTTDPDYETLKCWIQEGALNN